MASGCQIERGQDSHVANDNKEYIVFHNAQILSCYVLHLDWDEFNDIEAFMMEQMLDRTDAPRKKKAPPKNEILSPEDIQRRKPECLAQADKYFAYGFGLGSTSASLKERDKSRQRG
ncbi:hypothetical protein C8J56DRAFT_891808 [Mycena floridula]|nr:hypothetical protein C8J56DRAFT_891808 [Mycena floridula]